MSSTSDPVEQPREEMNQAIGPEVTVPGPYPSGQVAEHGDAEPEPTKETRTAGSLGDLTKEVSTSTMAQETGGSGTPHYDDEERRNN